MIFHQNVCDESVLRVEERRNTKHFFNICHDRDMGNCSWLHYEDRSTLWSTVILWVWWLKWGMPVLTMQLVTEGNSYEAHAGHLRIDIHDSNYNSWRVE